MSRKRTSPQPFGAIRKLPSGRWQASYRDPDKVRRLAPTTFTTKTAAQDWLATQRADVTRGLWRSPDLGAVLLHDYMSTYLDSRADLRPSTLSLYRRIAPRWIYPELGSGPDRISLGKHSLSELTPVLLRTWHKQLKQATELSATTSRRAVRGHPARHWAREKGLPIPSSGRLPQQLLADYAAAGSPPPRRAKSSSTNTGRTQAAHAYRLLRTVLNQAVKDGYLESQPLHIARAGHTQPAERHPLTTDELALLVGVLPEHYRAAALLAAWSGLRPGEVFALRRRDVDLLSATVKVCRTLLDIDGVFSFGPPKTDAGLRTVALPSLVVPALHQHLADHTGPDPDSLVFTTTTGRPVGSSLRSSAMRAARSRIGRDDIAWHHLRHTGATWAAQAGATLPDLMHRMGHSTPAAAMTYQHTSAARDRIIADRMNELIAPKSNVIALYPRAQ